MRYRTKDGIEFEFEGEEEDELLRAFAHSEGYRDYKGLGWSLILNFKTREIFAPVTSLRNTVFFSSLIMLLFALVLCFFISGSVSKPILKLRDDALEIGKGKLEILNKEGISKVKDLLNVDPKNLSSKISGVSESMVIEWKKIAEKLIDSFGQGSYYLFIKCVDESGNENEDPIFINFDIDENLNDTDPPEVIQTIPSNNVTISENKQKLEEKLRKYNQIIITKMISIILIFII